MIRINRIIMEFKLGGDTMITTTATGINRIIMEFKFITKVESITSFM